MKVVFVDDYSQRRAEEYPPLQELADALVHNAAGDPSRLEAYVQACRDVKARFPKEPVTPAGNDAAEDRDQ